MKSVVVRISGDGQMLGDEPPRETKADENEEWVALGV
jgi:hypothetical protein